MTLPGNVPGLSSGQLRTAVQVGAIGGAVFGLVTLGTMFGLGVLGALSAIISIVALLLLVAAVYVMFRPAANAYFAAARRA